MKRMALKPILFKGEMVNAILAGRKTQTRRLMKVQPPANTDQIEYKIATTMSSTSAKDEGKHHWLGIDRTLDYNVLDATQPYFNCPLSIGDILWVRETWCDGYLGTADPYLYRATYHGGADHKWKPSLFMPYVAARLFLKVTEVRVQQLNKISSFDAIAEGIQPIPKFGPQSFADYSHKAIPTHYALSPKYSYKTLWEKINGKGSWEENPWVWVYEFERTDKPTHP